MDLVPFATRKRGAATPLQCSICARTSDKDNWAAHRVRQQVREPIEDACQDCKLTATAFPNLTWEQLKDMASSNKQWLQIFTLINRRRLAEIPKDFRVASVASDLFVGVRMQTNSIFLTLEQFMQKFGMSPAEAGCTTEKFEDEEGNAVEGVLVRDPDRPHRRVIQYAAREQRISEEMLGMADHIRQEQAAEVFQSLRASVTRAHIRPSRIASMEELSQQVARVKATTAQAERIERAQENPSMQEGHEDEEEERVERLHDKKAGPMAPVAAVYSTVVPGKAKAKARPYGRRRQHTRCVDDDDGTAQRARQAGPAALRAVGDDEVWEHGQPDMRGPVDAIIEGLPLDLIIAGKVPQIGRKLYHAEQRLSSISKNPDFQADAVVLAAHVRQAVAANAVQEGNLARISQDELNAFLRTLASVVPKWPQGAAAGLVRRAARQVLQDPNMDSLTATKAFLALAWPCLAGGCASSPAAGGVFDPLNPSVAAAGFPADLAASLFQELAITKWLVNWMTKEAANPDELCSFVETFTTMRKLSEDGLVALSHEASHSLRQVFDVVSTMLAAVAAVAEVKVVVGNIRAIDAVRVVTECKAGRSSMGVVSAILKDVRWNQRVTKFWTTMVAEVTHSPNVAEVLEG
jgi:hypothetical protein